MMKGARTVAGWMLVSLLGSLCGMPIGYAEEETTETKQPAVHSSRVEQVTTTTVATPAKATSSKSEDGKLDRKLQQILDNQAEIFKRLDQIMEELKIIKIRASIAASRSN